MSRPSSSGAALEAHEYAKAIVAGSITACKTVKQACERHLRDCEASTTAEFPYQFKAVSAEKACRFIEALPHTKGRWARRGELIKLEPFQKFIVCSLFGWLHKTTKLYRFQEAYIEMCRKNAKSTLAAAIGLYKFCADKEFGAEIYSGATSEKQAWEVFRPALQMCQRTPQLRAAFGITTGAKAMAIVRTGSRFEPIIGKPGDGPSPSCGIVDEYHEHDSDVLYDSLKTGMAARDNPLLLIITTAGSDQSGPCFALRAEMLKILSGAVQDERRFCIIYQLDDTDDWSAPASLVKGNPNLGVSVSLDYLLGQQKSAVLSARKQNTFKTKHLGVWVNADVAWMPDKAWEKCCDPTLRLEDFEGQDCAIGLDLASVKDLAAKVYVFRKQIEGKTHFYVFSHHYLNERAVRESKGSHYEGWSADKRLIVTPGNITDYEVIAKHLVEDAKRFTIRFIPHDPYHAAPLIQFIQANPEWPSGPEFVVFRQTVEKMSPAMKELEAAVLDGVIHHDGDPVMGWEISNVVCHYDSKGNVMPRKQTEENKIDGPVALIMAKALMAGEVGSYYESHGLDSIGPAGVGA